MAAAPRYRFLYSPLAALLLIALCYHRSVHALSIHSSVFHGTPLRTRTTSSGSCSLTMRKQKASDKRTRRRQRFGADESSNGGVLLTGGDSSFTQSPMQRRGSWKEKKYVTPTKQKIAGRGRSRKRSTLYQSLAFYHNKFMNLLTQEYQAEEEEVLGRIKASLEDPLGLETAGYALLDLYPTRRGNLFADEVYRLVKAHDATTTYPRSVDESDAVKDNKFGRNDVIVLTRQPKGSGDFFDALSLPISDTAKTVEARVLNVGPTYMDVALSAGAFEAAFGPAPNDASGSGDASMRLRADRFVSNVPYQRMVSGLAQITSIPDRTRKPSKTEGEINKNPHSNICMDEVLREAILATHAYSDPHSPFLKDTDVCDIQELTNKLAKPPMATSPKLAQQALRYMKSNPNGLFIEFNAPQRAAIEAALSRRMTMIHGPPGTGKTTVAAAIGFGFVHQCRTISSNTKVLSCAFSNVGADNLAEALLRLGLRVVRVGKASAVSEALWDYTLDAAIDRDPEAQKAAKNAARATAQLAKAAQKTKGKDSQPGLSERTIRDAATTAVKASIEACNIAATKALREADVIVSTSTGAADPRLLAACGTSSTEESVPTDQQKAAGQFKGRQDVESAGPRTNAPDGLPPLSLPFVIVDEACQSVEPATLIPIVSTNSCRALVLLGDPCQLPPTVLSGQNTPLSVSLMERLSACLPHPSVTPQVDNIIKDTTWLEAKPVLQAKSLLHARERGGKRQPSYRKRFAGSLLLSIQYRMHPSIAAFSSAVFYDGQLASPTFMAEARAFPYILNKMMPCGNRSLCVRVIDVGGRSNERQGSSTRFTRTIFSSVPATNLEEKTSYWNEPEAERVISLVKDLLGSDDPGLQSIGVITPYNAQVQLIKAMMANDVDIQKMLRKMAATIEVNSVDGYQGRERDVIIFSAVRSNREGRIGFLHDWRRMNVALTRAKSALVVIGDLENLSQANKHWAALHKWATGARCIVDDYDSPEDEPSH